MEETEETASVAKFRSHPRMAEKIGWMMSHETLIIRFRGLVLLVMGIVVYCLVHKDYGTAAMLIVLLLGIAGSPWNWNKN